MYSMCLTISYILHDTGKKAMIGKIRIYIQKQPLNIQKICKKNFVNSIRLLIDI